MAVKILGLDKLKQKFLLLRVARNKDFLGRVGRRMTRYIQDMVRKGYSLEGGKADLLKPLSPDTIERRHKLSKLNRTSKYYAPAISNLHFTGQLINALKPKIEGKKVFVEVEDSKRKPIKTGKKTKEKNPPTNKDLAGYLAEQGRPFLGIDEEGRKIIREMVVSEIRKIIRRR